MQCEQDKQRRIELNGLMTSNDDFFAQFSSLDEAVYAEGKIPKMYKELMGLAISVATRCNECIAYHIDTSVTSGANQGELLEAIKIGVIAGGSITYPNARHAFAILRAMELL